MLTLTPKDRNGVVYELTLRGPEMDDAIRALNFSHAMRPMTHQEDAPLPPTTTVLERLNEWAKDQGVEVRMTSRLRAWFRSEIERSHASKADPIKELGLYDFQTLGVAHIKGSAAYADGRMRCLIADDPRLGKSVQALRAVADINGPILILCLKSLIPQWIEYVNRWLPDRPVIAVLKRDAEARRVRLKAALKHSDVVVIANWETVLMDIPGLFRIMWGALIGDEAHRLKARKSKTVQMVKRIQAVHILLLSGTFVEKTPADWWAPLSIIQPNMFASFWTWVSWYVRTSNNGFGTVLTGAKNSKLMREHLRPFVLRRRAQDVANMPEVVEEEIIVELPEEHRTIYDEAVKTVILELSNGELDIPNEAARITRLRQLTTHPALLDHELWGKIPGGKLDVLRDLLTDVIPQDEQVIIYSAFVDGAILAAHVSNGEVYAGEISDPESIARFQRGDSRTLCATPAKGGVGLNLYNANYVVYLDKPWSSIQWRQSKDRAVAMDKTHSVMIYTLVAKDTIDEYVVKVLMRKMRTISESDIIMQVKSVLVKK